MPIFFIMYLALLKLVVNHFFIVLKYIVFLSFVMYDVIS